MIIFERFSIFSSIFYLLSTKHSHLEDNQKVYYIDSGAYSLPFIPLISYFSNYEIQQLQFSLKNIKDNSGELERIRLTRDYLFKIKKLIINSPQYKSILYEIYSSDDRHNEYLRSYLEKSIVHSEIMKQGLWRAVFLIKVIEDYLNKNSYKNCLFVMDSRPWLQVIKDFSSKGVVMVDSQIRFLNYQLISPMNFLRGLPVFHFILKVFKYRKGTLQRGNLENNSLYLEGRGDIVFEKNGSHSDFLWEMDSNFPSKSIVYEYVSKEEKGVLDAYGVNPTRKSPLLWDIFNLEKKSLMPRFLKEFKAESRVIRDHFNHFNSNYLTVKSFFKRKNIKIYLTWNKYDADHIIKAAAVKKLGGVSAIWQIAFDGMELIDNFFHVDIIFSYSRLSQQLDEKIGSKFSYNIITGCTKDYKNENLLKKSKELRLKLTSNGAKHIVSVFDENSVSDDRWHTGHSLQKDNYKFILEELFKNHDLGIIFKPKSGKTLRDRLGEVNSLLELGERTGRCLVLDDINRETSAKSPIIASLASDLCIHGHLCAGSAGLEAYLAGTPTILIDREGCPFSKLYGLPEGKVIFRNWPETITSVNAFFNSNKKIDGYGDWEPILEDLEPFRDGLGARRMGFFLSTLKEALDQGKNREEAMLDAVNKYSDAWGADKVIRSKIAT